MNALPPPLRLTFFVLGAFLALAAEVLFFFFPSPFVFLVVVVVDFFLAPGVLFLFLGAYGMW